VVLLQGLRGGKPVSLGNVIVISKIIVEKALPDGIVTRPYSGSGKDYTARPLLLTRIYS